MNGHGAISGAIVDAHRSRTELSHCTFPPGGQSNAPPVPRASVSSQRSQSVTTRRGPHERRDRDGHRTQNTELTPHKPHSTQKSPFRRVPYAHTSVSSDAQDSHKRSIHGTCANLMHAMLCTEVRGRSYQRKTHKNRRHVLRTSLPKLSKPAAGSRAPLLLDQSRSDHDHAPCEGGPCCNRAQAHRPCLSPLLQSPLDPPNYL